MTEGYAGVAGRLVDRLSNRVSPPGSRSLAIAAEHIERAGEIAARGWVLPPQVSAVPGEPLTVAWLTEPPGPGSGGHTTMFRLVSALEKAGHRCIVYTVDRHAWEVGQHAQRIRSWWPWIDAEVRDAGGGIADAHAIFATGWETAYQALASPARGKRFYLVQDFEPSFYPAGSASLLAEATYTFGFHGVTAGRWLLERLRREYGMSGDYFNFGRDATYALDPSIPARQRNGVCFYSRPGTPRRAYELAVLALGLFAKRHPEIEIHVYGTEAKRLPFAVTNHGLQTPEQLNGLYNRCVAGLVLSATNVSLVPHEMLAAGCIPVVNDAEHNRIVLDNAHVAYSSPFELATTLSRLVARPPAERIAAAKAAAASVQSTSWEDVGNRVVRIIEEAVTRAVTAAN